MSETNPGGPPVASLISTLSREDFMGDAAAAALSQPYALLTMILSDDNPADRAFASVQETVPGRQDSPKILPGMAACETGLGGHAGGRAMLAGAEAQRRVRAELTSRASDSHAMRAG